jgi:formylglycine-generating enzyme required for sulfatase activity
MVRIEGGTYTYKSGERAVATLDVDVFETTIGEYQACVAAGGCRAVEGGSLLGQGCPTDDPSLPVACVTIPQAEEYCRWKGKRLPNLWEWGWAARGGEEARFYPWGDEPATCERAILGVPPMDAKGPEELGCGREGPWPVGSRPSGVSAHGLHDMMGNVAEWVPTEAAEVENTTTPQSNAPYHYNVGGSWRSGLNKTYAPWYLERFPGAQWLVGILGDTTVTDAVGFRCVKDVGSAEGTTGAP